MEGISEVIYLLIYLFTYFSHMTYISSSVACDRAFLDLRRPHVFQAEGEMLMSNYFIHSVIFYEDEMLTFFPTYFTIFLLHNVRLLTLHRHFRIKINSKKHKHATSTGTTYSTVHLRLQ
jgi:hypothetical protein